MQLELCEPVSGSWHSQNYLIEKFIQLPAATSTRLILISSKHLTRDQRLCEEFRKSLSLPICLFEQLCQRSNGFVGGRAVTNPAGLMQDYETWFRFQSKALELERVPGSSVEDLRYVNYHWDDVGFFIRANSNDPLLIIGFDLPQAVRANLLRYPAPVDNVSSAAKAGYFLATVVQEVVGMYDQAVWSVRDVIRGVEKRRQIRQKFFDDIHDVARHAIHTTEVLEVAVRTAKRLRNDVQLLCKDSNLVRSDDLPPTEFWVDMLANILSRAQSIEKRCNNEITLAFNTVTQRDSTVMKYIAVVTLAFLPSTFVSTIFSMSFFTQQQNTQTGEVEWLVSHWFWLYWVIAIPLTMLALFAWFKGRRLANNS